MGGCGCRGILRKSLDAYEEYVERWTGLRTNRPNLVSQFVRCDVCLRTWRLKFELVPDTLPSEERGRVSGPFKPGE